jgi:hypothetical protein
MALGVAACASAEADVATSAVAAEGPDTTTAAAAVPATTAETTTTQVATTTVPPETTTTTMVTTTTESPYARPAWLGTRLLPLRSDDFGEVQPTPPEMVDRRFETLDLLPPPNGDTFTSTLGPIPEDVLMRSSWREDCPVGVDDLVYLTVTHYGFDGEFHTGEMIVNAAVGQDIVGVFRELHAARFPIEQMRVITAEEIDAHPTGDWNDTTSFVCRPAVGSGRWSQHAYGLAIDINPFHNPYLKGDLVLPELASAYLDRSEVRPGMIISRDVVDQAFASIGWTWGGRWNSLKDWMHFSRNGN